MAAHQCHLRLSVYEVLPSHFPRSWWNTYQTCSNISPGFSKYKMAGRDKISDQYRTSNQDYGAGAAPSSRSSHPSSGGYQYQTSSNTRGASKGGRSSNVHNPSLFSNDSGHHHSTSDTSGYGNDQRQTHAQRQRSTQASKQMAYDVFGNVITALETFEKRNEGSHGTSNIHIPSQSWKNDGDVKASVEAQLRVFEQHMKHCPEDVRREIRPQMKKMTVDWMAARDRGARTKTDDYAVNLFEILGKGSTKHDDALLRDQRHMRKTELLDNFDKVMHGLAKADELDRMFEHDPYKTAKAPDVRRGASTSYGVERLTHIKPDLESYMDDVPGYHGSHK